MGENKSLLKILGGLFAFLTVILIGLLIINEKYLFVTDINLLEALYKVKDYMVLGSLVIIGFAFVPKRGFLGILIFLIYMAAVVVIIVFTFLPGMWW